MNPVTPRFDSRRPSARDAARFVLVTLGLGAGGAAFARTDFELYGDLRNALAAEHLRGDAAAAHQLRRGVAAEAKPGSSLAAMVASDETDATRQAALRYMSGTQQEYFCRGKGLVYAEGAHDDGAWSKLVLIDGKREMIDGSYAQMSDGQWTYELADSYRPAERSQLWMTDGSAHAYSIIEIRSVDPSHADKGVWDTRWSERSTQRNWSVNGGGSGRREPARLYMALHYQLWSGWDLGYKLAFVAGAKDEVVTAFHDRIGRIDVKAVREVVEHLPSFAYQDAAGTSYEAADCFRVQAKMTAALVPGEQ
jgi:hypothetical protein